MNKLWYLQRQNKPPTNQEKRNKRNNYLIFDS